MCEWCVESRSGGQFPRRAWLVFPNPDKMTWAHFPVVSQDFRRLTGDRPGRPARCVWRSRSEPDPCPGVAAWRVSSDFVVGHLCERHRDAVSRAEGPAGVETWLRELGVQVSRQFRPIRPSAACEYSHRSSETHECRRLACAAETISSSFEVCERHYGAFSKSLTAARKLSPPDSAYRGWWWE